jgi:hypothetical protein
LAQQPLKGSSVGGLTICCVGINAVAVPMVLMLLLLWAK